MNERGLRRLAIIGGGNIGLSLAKGLIKARKYEPADITITRRMAPALEEIKKKYGFSVSTHNLSVVERSDLVVLAVLPQQLNQVLDEVRPAMDPKRHVLISVVSGVATRVIQERMGMPVEVVRAMPNTAIAIGQSMTCIGSDVSCKENMQIVDGLFRTVGECIQIHEELMTAATALNACGIAFFLRAARAASQGGIEIGFHAEDALRMAAQTAKGAASLLLTNHSHPETEIDKVTSPKGCTISGLNEMEHHGFSSALIKGIRTSYQKAGGLYDSAARGGNNKHNNSS